MSSRWSDRARDACTSAHSQKVYPPGEWRRGDNEEFGFVVLSNGVVQFRTRCRECGHTSTALPNGLARGWGLTAVDFTWEQINPPRDHEPCSVRDCRMTPTEYHHFAPYNTFGAAANNWPILPLCRDHHVEWHQRMNGYLWHRKGVA